MVNKFRDLGAFINLTSSASSSTLNGRLKEGTNAVHRVNRLPIPRKEKAHVIRTKAIQMATYGAEASLLSEPLQKKLTTARKNVVSKPCQHKDTNLTFITSSYGPDLDTETVVINKRAALIRRSIA